VDRSTPATLVPPQRVDDRPAGDADGVGRTPRHGYRDTLWVPVFVLAFLFLVVQFASVRSGSHLQVAASLAVLPFAVVLLAVRSLGTHRPEPVVAQAWAVLFGALVATNLSSYATGLLGGTPGFVSIVAVAPVVEETVKMLGLLLLYRWGRVRGVLDGVLYAALIGIGFAMTENVHYFAQAAAQDLTGDTGLLRNVFIARGVLYPLAHPLFLAVGAIALGVKSRSRTSNLVVAVAWLGGICLHVLWNYAALTAALPRFGGAIVATFLAACVALVVAIRGEQDRVRTNLPLLVGDERELIEASLRRRYRLRAPRPAAERPYSPEYLREVFRAAAVDRSLPAGRSGRSRRAGGLVRLLTRDVVPGRRGPAGSHPATSPPAAVADPVTVDSPGDGSSHWAGSLTWYPAPAPHRSPRADAHPTDNQTGEATVHGGRG